MDRIWLIIAGCCAIVSGVFLLLGKFDGAFVTGTLGVLAWFVDVRGRLNKNKSSGKNSTKADIDALGRQDED